MTNLEHYKGYIEKLIKKGTTPAKVKGRLTTCKSTRCYDCDFGPHAAECRLNILKWYMAEHEEFELNKDERKFCEALNKGFLIRTRSGRVERSQRCLRMAKLSATERFL